MKLRSILKYLLVFAAVSLTVAACYTVSSSGKKKDRVSKSVLASRELQAATFDYVKETLYAYPHVATQVGKHLHELPSGEKIRLDRELPNFSEDLIAARIGALKGYLERLDEKTPKRLLSLNDQADRRLLIDAVKREIFELEEEKIHTSNPLVHASALYEAIYYPTVMKYAPEAERAADLLGRLNWIPSYVDRAIRLTEKSSEAYNGPAAAMVEATATIIEKDLARMVKGDDTLETSFQGMQKPVAESLEKFAKFLKKGIKKKGKRTWRMGSDDYEELYELTRHEDFEPKALSNAARSRIEELKKELFTVAKPFYCEENETDRKVCGPTKAELAAAAKAEEKKRKAESEKARKAEEKAAREEEKKRKQEEKKRKQEEKKRKAEEEKARKAEEKAAKEEERKRKQEEKKRKAEEEKARKAEEKAAKEEEKAEEKKDDDKKDDDKKDDDKPTNPYADPEPEEKPKKKDDDKPTNPYAFGIYQVPQILGAKLVDDDDEEAKPEGEKAEDEKGDDEKSEDEKSEGEEESVERGMTVKDADDGTISKVVGFVFERLLEPKPAGPRPPARLEKMLKAAALRGEKLGVVGNASSDGLQAGPMPVHLQEQALAFSYHQAPLFEEDAKAEIYAVAGGEYVGASDMPGQMMELVAARYGSPGIHEVFRGLETIENEPRKALRSMGGDPAFAQGWGLYAALLTAHEDSWKSRFFALHTELVAAVDLLVDFGLHTDGMKEKAAKDLYEKTAALPKKEAERRLALVKISPLTSSFAFAGFLKWQEVVGSGDDAAKLRDKALALGPVPLSLLKEMLEGSPDEYPDTGEEDAPVDEGPKHVTIFDKN